MEHHDAAASFFLGGYYREEWARITDVVEMACLLVTRPFSPQRGVGWNSGWRLMARLGSPIRKGTKRGAGGDAICISQLVVTCSSNEAWRELRR